MSTKQYLLELLENNRGKNISGEDIAEQLHVSRTAVWKAVRELEKDGYQIQAATHRGYCLSEDNDILSVPGLRPFLDKAGTATIYVYNSLESTNNTAKEMAAKGARHGTVVIADHQTGGRGRRGRSFFSPPGQGIYMTFILHPAQLPFDTPTKVTAFAAVSVCEAIAAVSGREPQIKWVNDIFLAGKKVCGILTEAVTDLESGGIQWIVVGIGINVSVPLTDFPAELQERAGSVFPSGPPPVTRNRLAAEVINRMLFPHPADTGGQIMEQYKKRLMMLGEPIWVNGWDESYRAEAVDIDAAGHLIVKTEGGELRTLSAGEISIRW